jgi:hypothetical protein
VWTTIVNRRTFTLKTLATLFLAVAVFGWGLQYKVSLYDLPGSHLNSVSHAKLLSEKERPASTFDLASSGLASLQPQSSFLLPTFFLASMMIGLSSAKSPWTRVVSNHGKSRQHRFSASTFFSFRPPPATHSR